MDRIKERMGPRRPPSVQRLRAQILHPAHLFSLRQTQPLLRYNLRQKVHDKEGQ
jgi:hypothetical protein